MSNPTLQVGESKWASKPNYMLGYYVDPQTGKYRANEFNVNRNSPKWVLGKNGQLVQYASDEIALAFNADGTEKGVLIEPESTNYARQSEDLDNSTYWATFNTTIAGDTETDPKGGTNSFLLAETITNAGHSVFIDPDYTPTITSGETWTQSVYLKKGSGANAPDIMQLTFGSATHGATQYANFNISTGTVLTTSSGTATIKEVGNGWYRCSWTATATSTGGGIVGIVFTNNDDSLGRLPFYTGQTNANVFIWGAQLEQSPIATSYIPTTGSKVTRLKDDVYLTGASDLIGQSEGTLFVEVDWRGVSGISQVLFEISDSTTSDRIFIVNDSGTDLQMRARANDTFVTEQGESSTVYTGIQKIAFAYKTDDFELYRNGSSISTDTSGSLASLATMTDVDFGQTVIASGQANMYIRSVRIYDTRLSDAECEALTTVDSFDSDYLVVAGGGGGGNSQISDFPRSGGGGGAGGLLEGTTLLDYSTLYTVTVGNGGNGATGDATPGGNGQNSLFGTFTAIGGGGGGGSNADNAKDGGSGGGGGESQPAGIGTAGQGKNGGNGADNSGGGGGGAGESGFNSSPNNGGDGGDGVQSSITGTLLYYAGGGGGGGITTAGDAGLGGGGNGGANADGSDGQPNTGGGGGGTGDGNSNHYDGGNGGSGVVIISYPNNVDIQSNGVLEFTTTSVGNNKVTKFTSGTGQISFNKIL